MDVGALVTFLAPALGFLLGVGQDVAERARGSLGEVVWDQAGRLWDRLRPKVEADPATRAAAEEVAERPDDPEARAALTFLVKRLLAADPELARTLEGDWEKARTVTTATASGERSVAIAGDASGNVILTGDRVDLPPPRT